MTVRGLPCAYCGAPAKHKDHVVPKALRRRHKGWDDVTIPACVSCNLRRGTRRYVCPEWESRIPELPGKGWQVWRGGPHLEVLR